MKIGDTVSVIDEDLSGEITSVHGNTVVIRDEFGFTHKIQKSKIVERNASLYENVSNVEKSIHEKSVSKKHNRNHKVVDLHFENLVENPKDYESFERLLIQKDALIAAFDFCRENNLKKLEIIHGIGDGVLQNMVHDFLVGQTDIEFDDHDFFYHQRGSVLVKFR